MSDLISAITHEATKIQNQKLRQNFQSPQKAKWESREKMPEKLTEKMQNLTEEFINSFEQDLPDFSVEEFNKNFNNGWGKTIEEITKKLEKFIVNLKATAKEIMRGAPIKKAYKEKQKELYAKKVAGIENSLKDLKIDKSRGR